MPGRKTRLMPFTSAPLTATLSDAQWDWVDPPPKNPPSTAAASAPGVGDADGSLPVFGVPLTTMVYEPGRTLLIVNAPSSLVNPDPFSSDENRSRPSGLAGFSVTFRPACGRPSASTTRPLSFGVGTSFNAKSTPDRSSPGP